MFRVLGDMELKAECFQNSWNTSSIVTMKGKVRKKNNSWKLRNYCLEINFHAKRFTV